MKATILTLVVVVAGGGILGGCGHELFVDANNGGPGRGIDKYYDGDSCVQTRESRRKANDMGFGYPAGLLPQ